MGRNVVGCDERAPRSYATSVAVECHEMKQEWEPFRLVMEAVGEADRLLKAEAESQEEKE